MRKEHDIPYVCDLDAYLIVSILAHELIEVVPRGSPGGYWEPIIQGLEQLGILQIELVDWSEFIPLLIVFSE